MITKKRTPVDSMGVKTPKQNRFTTCIDWFQATFPTKLFSIVKEIIKYHLGIEGFIKQPGALKLFKTVYKHPTGLILATGHRAKKKIDWSLSYIEMSGSVIRFFEQIKLLDFFIALRDIEANCTRLDLAIDDHSMTLDIDEIKKSVKKGYLCGFRSAVKYVEEGINAEKGHSISFGHRGSQGSGKYVTFYNKAKESKGKLNSIRVELASYKHRATQMFNKICDTPFEELGKTIFAAINGAIDFRKKKKGETHLNRAKRLPFWRFMDDCEKFVPVFNYVEKTLEDVKEWVIKQIAPTMAMLFTYFCDAYDGDYTIFTCFIHEIIEHGEKRLNNKHLFKIARQLASSHKLNWEVEKCYHSA